MMILGLMVDIIVVVNEVGGGASLRQHWKRRERRQSSMGKY